ncbi:lipid A deacylase LpxR family protein [Cognatishimia activa]|uniref:lipid A deacylase LpxR family protein n=1 Tax=Cognatishimia activa TaxID=1715691 RepID=UPI00222EA15C|nr:lipid A deacylase LpxR family protein [Cognatishimia activa]UZD89987.1 lipid A deacylase LpxR family protein [Cognatishimia activa]
MGILKTILAASLVFGGASSIAVQAEAEQIGYGRLIVNDFLGDGQDRWRSGSIVGSHLYGQPWGGQRPEGFGDLIEMRIMGQVIAPDNLQSPDPTDRPYAGALSIGAHTHFERSGFDIALGADLTLVGPSSGIGDIQTWLHNAFSVAEPSDTVLNNQVGNKLALTGVAEVGYIYELSENARLRPFVEARAGDETLLRAGFDFTLGQFGHDELLVRDPVSGQRYQTTYQNRPGWSFLAGADFAVVQSSIYLPASSGVTIEDTRERYRIGMNWQGESTSVYYGATWLSPEFTGQDEGQVVGAVRIRFDF